MANMKKVNHNIKARFPHLEIQAVKGHGYIYFDGVDGFDRIDSIFTNPSTISTDDLSRICIEDISFQLNIND